MYRFIDDLNIPKECLSFGGLKRSMFSPENLFSLTLTPVSFLRMYFKKGFKLYNRYQKLKKTWTKLDSTK